MSECVVPEMTYQFNPSGVPLHRPILKRGVPVMIIRNVLFPDLVNGKMFNVERITRKAVRLASLASDESVNLLIAVPRIDIGFSFHGVEVIRRPFPFRNAFTGTVHKAQGHTLGKAIVVFRSPYFSPGQINVALLRVQKLSDVLLLYKESDIPRGARNIHSMSVAVSNPVLKEAVELVEIIQ